MHTLKNLRFSLRHSQFILPLYRGLSLGLLLAGATWLISGCATLFAPSSDSLQFESEPSGAKIYLGARLLGITPCSLKFDRDSFRNHHLTFRKEGYQSKSIYLNRSLDNRALFNLGFITTTSGASSWGIDFLSGNMFEYSPGSYLVELPANGQTQTPEEEEQAGGPLPMSWVASHFQPLRGEIARGEVEHLKVFHRLVGSRIPFELYASGVEHQRLELASISSPVGLYRSLKSLAN